MSDYYTGISDEVLDSTWRDADLARLSQNIVSWEELAPFWGLTEAEEEEIKKDNHSYAAQKLAALRRWKSKCSKTATYRQLMRVFARMSKMELVEKVREILLNPEEVPTGGPGDVLSNYREFLEMNYSQLPQPVMLFKQAPLTNTYCILPLSKRPSNEAMRRGPLHTGYSPFLSHLLPEMFTLQHGNVGNELEEQEVHLPQLLSKTGGSLVIKGLPGSGKTTLTWHTSQQWAKRELFQQFSLFLSIPLRSTRVQHATCLADLIPHPDQEQRKAIAQAISASSGEDMCFWFDGWDEMPQKVQRDSFVASFIRRDSPGSSLPKCTAVVTTRPEASSLRIKSSEEIWMNGLTRNKVNEIITKSVEGTDHDPSELIASLESNTSLQAFCSTVPINIAILVSLFFLFQSGIPNTQTDLFKCLVLNLLLHNLQLRWELGITSLRNFAELPDLPAEFFRSICEIAFNGVTKAKTVFIRSDISSLQKQHSLSLSTFGLMKISPHIEWYGVEEELTFLHTTLQEFLAAVHLTTIENKEQARIVKKIVNSESWHQKSILQFYVGLTGFKNSFNIILERCCTTLNPMGLYNRDESGLSSFVTFVNCIFEAQSGHLCHKVTHNRHFLNRFKSNEFDVCLSFSHTRFTTSDFSHLGYFIGWFCQQKTCELKFDSCYITPHQYDLFVKQVKQVWNNELHRPSLSLLYSDFPQTKLPAEFRYEQLRSICQLIKDTNLVSQFNIRLFFYSIYSPAFTHYFAAMKNVVEALARNSSCSYLILNYDVLFLCSASLSDMLMVELYSEYYVILLITFCKHLKKVAFHDFFQFHYSYPHFACALRHNTNIQEIDLSRNRMMNENAIANIAQALGYNETVEMVNFGDWMSTEELAVFLDHYAIQWPVRSGLRRVLVGYKAIPGEEENKIIKVINFMRMRSGQPPEHSFCVIRYIEADEYGDGWVPSHYVVYTGFGKQVIDRSSGAHDGFGVASDVTEESSYESDEHSCTDRDSTSYFEGHVSHVEDESSAGGESNYKSNEHRDSDGDSASYFGDWISQFESGSDEGGDHN